MLPSHSPLEDPHQWVRVEQALTVLSARRDDGDPEASFALRTLAAEFAVTNPEPEPRPEPFCLPEDEHDHGKHITAAVSCYGHPAKDCCEPAGIVITAHAPEGLLTVGLCMDCLDVWERDEVVVIDNSTTFPTEPSPLNPAA